MNPINDTNAKNTIILTYFLIKLSIEMKDAQKPPIASCMIIAVYVEIESLKIIGTSNNNKHIQNQVENGVFLKKFFFLKSTHKTRLDIKKKVI